MDTSLLLQVAPYFFYAKQGRLVEIICTIIHIHNRRISAGPAGGSYLSDTNLQFIYPVTGVGFRSGWVVDTVPNGWHHQYEQQGNEKFLGLQSQTNHESCVTDYVSGCLHKINRSMRGEREIRLKWSATYAILMSIFPNELAAGAVA